MPKQLLIKQTTVGLEPFPGAESNKSVKYTQKNAIVLLAHFLLTAINLSTGLN